MQPDMVTALSNTRTGLLRHGTCRSVSAASRPYRSVRPGRLGNDLGSDRSERRREDDPLRRAHGTAPSRRRRVMLGGRDMTRLGTHRRARLGIARTFQRLELFWSLNVEDNVLVGAEAKVQWWRVNPFGQASRSATAAANPGSRASAVMALLDRVGLADLGQLQVGLAPPVKPGSSSWHGP